ncbi:MAG: GTPase domain-containing protein, partial [Vicinamibacteria bacterium]|nr:GTPase domain-containing protein [Vicinamibacteria bacterium]
MVLFNYSTKELTAKVVYYGAGLCGKTTNLQWIHEQLPIRNKGKMLSLATEADRTLFFDFLPIELGTIRGMKTRVQLYTVPGQVFYNATRRMVLKGADCVVFVADSQDAMIDANSDAMKNLRENLVANELDPDNIPLVIQYNKRDLPNAASLDELNKVLNARGVPFIEASAKSGTGVEETLKVATQLVFRVLANKYGNEGGASPRSAEAAPKPAAIPARAPAPPPSPPPLPPPIRVAPPKPKAPTVASPRTFASNDDLLDSLGGPGPSPVPAPALSLDNELDLGPSPGPAPVDFGDPLDALSGPGTPAPGNDPFGPELSLDSLGEAPGSGLGPAGHTGELELDLVSLGPAAGPGDPFGDSPFGEPPPPPPASVPPSPLPLDDPFGSSLEGSSPFDSPPPEPKTRSTGSALDAMAELGAPGGSSSFTSDPINVEAAVDIPAGALK